MSPARSDSAYAHCDAQDHPMNDKEEFQKTTHEAASTAAENGDYLNAIDLYDQVLASCDGDADKLLKYKILNERANSNHAHGRFESALADAMAAIECLNGPNMAESAEWRRLANFTAGRAAYSMHTFDRAAEFFQAAQNVRPTGAIGEMLKRSHDRLVEQTTGSYDFEKMLRDLIQRPAGKVLDHASFIGNTEIRMTAASGRGLFATKDLKLGDLVLCEKAFAISFEKEDLSDTLRALLNQVLKIVRHNPTARAKFYGLSDEETAPARYPGYHFSKQVIDMIKLNSFEFHSISTFHGTQHDEATNSMPRMGQGTTAVYIHTSLFNHSCMANVGRSHIGDMIIMRALRPIQKGEELTISYFDTGAECPDRKYVCGEKWYFECRCKRCKADATTTVQQQNLRDQLIAESTTLINAAYGPDGSIHEPADIEGAKRLLRGLRSTYGNPANKGLPHLPLIDLGRFLAEYYFRSGDPKAEQAVVSLLMDLGYAREDEDGGLVLDLAGARDMPEYAKGVTLLAAKMLHAKQLPWYKKIFIDLSREIWRTLFGATVGFEESADRNETGWMTDLGVSSM